MKKHISALLLIVITLLLCRVPSSATEIKEPDRFRRIYMQRLSASDVLYILEDRETGVQYLQWWGYGVGGITPLIDDCGTPIVCIQ